MVALVQKVHQLSSLLTVYALLSTSRSFITNVHVLVMVNPISMGIDSRVENPGAPISTMGAAIKNASGSCTSHLVDTYRVPDMQWYYNDQARPHRIHPPAESLPSSHFPEPWARSHGPFSDI
ncbi:hypothetical protein GGR55DRAFT_668617, partial [Xylaria sp. FL0064]